MQATRQPFPINFLNTVYLTNLILKLKIGCSILYSIHIYIHIRIHNHIITKNSHTPNLFAAPCSIFHHGIITWSSSRWQIKSLLQISQVPVLFAEYSSKHQHQGVNSYQVIDNNVSCKASDQKCTKSMINLNYKRNSCFFNPNREISDPDIVIW